MDGGMMQGGDISNQLAPTLAFDIDGLILFKEKRLFGLVTKEQLNYDALRVCEHHYINGRMIYLLAHDRSEEEVKQLEFELDKYDFPYTRLFHIDGDVRREAILSRNHIHQYYYSDRLHAATTNKRKEKRILNITEAYF